MCGRFTLFASAAEIEDAFGVTVPDAYAPSYNVAPGQAIPVVDAEAPDSLQFREWGFLPESADDPDQSGHVNARAETIEDRQSFEDAVASRRCVVVADGFYEWTGGDANRPYRFAFPDDRVFGLAGIWARWRGTPPQVGLDAFGSAADGPDEVVRETVAIVTTAAREPVASVHDRMPVVLPAERSADWLDASDPAARADVLAPEPPDGMDAARAAAAVNDPANDSPDVLTPADS